MDSTLQILTSHLAKEAGETLSDFKGIPLATQKGRCYIFNWCSTRHPGRHPESNLGNPMVSSFALHHVLIPSLSDDGTGALHN